MSKSLLRTDEEIESIYKRNVQVIYKICFTFMKNRHEAEDAVQETFLKLISSGKSFESSEHEKAWLIRTASNICKNNLKHWFKKREDIDEHINSIYSLDPPIDETLQAVMNLPDKYKTVVILYYYEGYSSVDIARILKRPESTIRFYLCDARKILKKSLGDSFYEQ